MPNPRGGCDNRQGHFFKEHRYGQTVLFSSKSRTPTPWGTLHPISPPAACRRVTLQSLDRAGSELLAMVGCSAGARPRRELRPSRVGFPRQRGLLKRSACCRLSFASNCHFGGLTSPSGDCVFRPSHLSFIPHPGFWPPRRGDGRRLMCRKAEASGRTCAGSAASGR